MSVARRSSPAPFALISGLAAASLLTTACATGSSSTTTASAPPPEGVEVLDAMRLEGPFRDLSEFCQLLGADTCDDDEAAVAMPTAGASVTTGDGQALRLIPVVSTEGGSMRTWLMFERGGQLWALPPAFEHPTDSPLVPTVTVTALRHDSASYAPELVRVDWNVAFRPQGSDEVAQRFEVTELCLVPAGEALACAHVNTSATVDRDDRMAAVELRVVEGNEIVVTPIQTADAELSARLPAEGRYQLRLAR